VEKLRAAEALARLVSFRSPAFLAGRQEARDRAFQALGLYWEHDLNMIGRELGPRLAWRGWIKG
jgi:alpha-mannosidase